MKAKIELEINEFTVPGFVSAARESDGEQEHLSGIPLSDLDESTLWRLCQNFTGGVFKKAKKEQPPKQACRCGVEL